MPLGRRSSGTPTGLVGESALRRLGTLASLVLLGLFALAGPRAEAAPPSPMAGGADCVPPTKLGAVFVVDDSGSNLTTDPDELRRDAAVAGLASLPVGSAVSVSTFSGEAATHLPTTDLTAANRAASLAHIGGMTLANTFDGTNYEAGFVDAISKLEQMSTSDKRIVIFLTDGEPTEAWSSDQTIAAMGVPIFSLGYGSADHAILDQMSAGSGGKLYRLQSSDDARRAFSDILDKLTCRSVFDPTDPTLPPGENYTRTFRVGPMTTYFRATVGWGIGAQPRSIEFERPDGSSFPRGGSAHPNESLVQGEGSVQLAVDNPPVGTWKVKVKGNPDEQVSLDVEAATASDVNPGECPAGATGVPKVQVGSAIAFGCFTDEGNGRFTTPYPARIGGFDADPDNDNLAPGRSPNLLILNTTDGRIETQGRVTLGLGGALLPGSPEDLPVGQASFAFNLDNAINCVRTAEECVLDSGPAAGLEAPVVDLWGFDVAGSVTASWTTEGNGGARLEFKPSVDKILGPLLSRIIGGKEPVLEATGGGSLINATLNVTATNDGGFELGASQLSISPFKITDKPNGSGTASSRLEWPVGISAIGDRKSFGEEEGYLWEFQVSISFPQSAGLKIKRRITAEGSPDLGAAGRVYVFDGGFAGGGAEASGLNIPLGSSPIFLQRVSLDILIEPGFGLNAETGLSGGPKFGGQAVVEGDPIAVRVGTLAECQTDASPDNLPFQVAGTLKVPPAELVAGTAELNASLCYIFGDNAIEGSAGVNISFLNDLGGLSGDISGWIDDSKFNLEGSGSIKIPGLPDPSGSIIASSVGIAGCGGWRVFWQDFKGGVGYRWGGSVDVFTGCDLSPWEQPRPSRLAPRAAVARGTGPNTFQVRRGLDWVGFRVNGAGGAPVVQITGPKGAVYASPAGPQGTLAEDLLSTQIPQLGQTFVFIRKPRPGKYAVTQVGGAPITTIETSRPLPEPRVRGQVRAGPKGKRTLRYRVRRIDGQRVTFYERGSGIAKRIGTAKHARGKLVFRPARGGSRKRKIVAVVTQAGLPRTTRTVERYKVDPYGPPPGRVQRVMLRGSPKRGYTLRWSKAPRAKRYYVTVRYRGRTLERGVAKRKLRLGEVSAKRVRVKIQPARGARVGAATKERFGGKGG